MILAILIAALIFAIGVAFGLWIAGQLDAAPFVEDVDGYCAGCGAKEADAIVGLKR